VDTFEVDREGPVVYAGFWRRLGAFVVDWIIVTLLILLVAFVIGVVLEVLLPGSRAGEDAGWAWLIPTLITLLYYPLQESSTAQATLGKRVFNIIVTDSQRRRISFWRALGRYLAKIVSAMTLGIGYLMAGFTAHKQALHDMLADTLVVVRN
jgi:uncharacterized RDD family membrane protein YckC